jgi:hypothetical protein
MRRRAISGRATKLTGVELGFFGAAQIFLTV